jgi:Family of unknown function (DUF6526)
MSVQQSYANHARYYPLYHFVVFPILLANAVVALRAVFATPSFASAWSAVVAITLVLLGWSARAMALTVQDRVIRLEERLRLERILPADLLGVIPTLKRHQLVALRFAGDSELADIVRRIQQGELTAHQDIKKAVKIWRPDLLRA